MRSILCVLGLVGGLAAAAGNEPPRAAATGAAQPQAGEIPVRTDPALKETARDLKPGIWINPDIPKEERPRLLWVRTVWGMTEGNLYRNWETRQPWGGAENWYLTWTDVARFKGKLIVGFQELNEAHAYGDSVQHIIVSEDDGATWMSAAHYEVPSRDPRDRGDGKGHRTAGFVSGYFCRVSEDRLMMSGRAGHGKAFWHASAFTEDGLAWTPLRKWTWEGVKAELAGHDLETFRPAWCGERFYGGTRGGQVWSGKGADRLVWERVRVEDPADGRVAGNETAAAFVNDRWFLFLRCGQISTSKPPYARWDINVANVRGPHSYGGPNVKSLPDGEVLTSSRGSVAGGRNQAVIFSYDGKSLTPVVAAPSGATATGYPGFAWEDGHLWMSFMSDNDLGKTPEQRSRGLVTVAKFAWPLRPGAKDLDAVCSQREAALAKVKAGSGAELVSVRRIGEAAAHSGYTDLIRFKDRWLCCYREGDDGVVFGCRPRERGKVRVLSSDDGAAWKSAAVLAEEAADLREPRLAVTPGGRLMLTACGMEGGVGHSRVAFSDDGAAWTEFQKVSCPGADGGAWLTRPAWNKTTAHAFIRDGEGKSGGRRLLAAGADGVNFSVVNDYKQRKPAPSRRYAVDALVSGFGGGDAAIRFQADGELVFLGESPQPGGLASLCRSRPPYAQWDVWLVNVVPHAPVRAPNFLVLPDGQTWAVATKAVPRLKDRHKVILYRLQDDTLIEILELPSAGTDQTGCDQGWPGMVWQDGQLWVSYHSGHEAKATGRKACVYLARIKLPPAGG